MVDEIPAVIARTDADFAMDAVMRNDNDKRDELTLDSGYPF